MSEFKNHDISRRAALKGAVGLSLTAGAAATALGVSSNSARAAADMLGVSRPSYYRYKLGDFEVTSVIDGVSDFGNPHQNFGINVSAEELAQAAEENFLPAERLLIGFVPTVVNTGSELVLFDTGNGDRNSASPGTLVASLQAAGYTADQIDVVVLTHLHPDHIGGMTNGDQPVFPNARYVVGQVEYDFWTSDDRLGTPAEGLSMLVRGKVVPFAEKSTFIGNGDAVVSGITGVASFGHTPGHMAYHIESGSSRLMITGDAANHPVFALQNPDWHFGFDADKAGAVAARKELFGLIASDKIPFVGYHMPFPSVGYVEPMTGSDGFRFVPVSYQLEL